MCCDVFTCDMETVPETGAGEACEGYTLCDAVDECCDPDVNDCPDVAEHCPDWDPDSLDATGAIRSQGVFEQKVIEADLTGFYRAEWWPQAALGLGVAGQVWKSFGFTAGKVFLWLNLTSWAIDSASSVPSGTCTCVQEQIVQGRLFLSEDTDDYICWDEVSEPGGATSKVCQTGVSGVKECHYSDAITDSGEYAATEIDERFCGEPLVNTHCGYFPESDGVYKYCCDDSSLTAVTCSAGGGPDRDFMNCTNLGAPFGCQMYCMERIEGATRDCRDREPWHPFHCTLASFEEYD